MIYLKPIINATGNYYIETQTRDERRINIIVDYLGKQFIVELKIWHNSEYNERKKAAYGLFGLLPKKGYMLSFNFNKNKEMGVKKLQIENKMIVEVVI